MGPSFEHPLLSLPENRFAQAALERLLAAEPDFAPPIVYLYGPTGCGKSHLIVHYLQQMLARYESLRVRVMSVYEYSTLHMELAAGPAPQAERTLAELTELDVLICEDLHYLDKQLWLQKKLVLLLDALMQSGTRMVLVSQPPIGDYQQVLPRLVSRVHGGVTASIAAPDEPSRVLLLQHFAASRGMTVDDEVAQKMARKLPVSPRELLGMIVQLEALQRLQHRDLTIGLVDEFLALQQARKLPTLSEIARSVAKEFGVTVQSIRSSARQRSLLVPRQVAMLLSRELIQANFSDIGAYYGGRSHSTVMHSCQALEKKSRQNPELDYRVSQLRRSLRGEITHRGR